jgi:2-polyprenyl-3-methyl-5-hydroxy-6-metoxy-1,4-benzoquinol methylase
MNLTESQKQQEEQYSFPYHYLVNYEDNNISLSKNWGWAIEYLGRITLLDKQLDNIEFTNYLDIGCGDGKLINILSKKFTKRFIGIDYSKQAISLAKAFNNNKNVEYKVFDMFNDKMEENFDVISMVEVIEHIEPTMLNLFLQNSINFLNSNGYFIGSVPSQQLELISKHYQHFSIESLSELLSKHLEIIEIDYIDNKNFISRFLNKFAYIVNSSKVQNFAFNYYKNNCLKKQNSGEGIFFICKKK